MKDSYSFDVDARPASTAPFQQHFEAYRRDLRPRCGLEHARGRGVVGRDGRQRVDRVHGRDRRGRGLVASLRALRLRGERREGDLASSPAAERRAGARRARAVPDAGRAHDRGSRRGSRAARRRSARSRRSSTCSTASSTLVLLRGDHALSEQKLADASGAREMRPANAEEIRAALGAGAGQPRRGRRRRHAACSPTRRSQGRRNMTTGANQDDLPPARRRRRARHRRDALARPARRSHAGEACPSCGAPLRVAKTDRGRPHLQARHAVQRGARRDGARRGRQGACRSSWARTASASSARWPRWSSAATTRTASSGR